MKLNKFIEKKLKNIEFQKKYTLKKKEIEQFKYIVHTNELEGHEYLEEELELLLKVCFGEISSKKALNIFKNF